MMKRLIWIVLVCVAALGVAGCLWAIGVGQEPLAVTLGCLGLLAFISAWLMALPAALRKP
jgi:hypothetical protein